MIDTADRKVMVSPELMEQWTRWRRPDGYLVTCDWGQPGPDGFYDPVFTVHYDNREYEDTPPYTGPALGYKS